MSVGMGRAARVKTADLEARLDSELTRLVNVSATGALLRTTAPFLQGRQCWLKLSQLPDVPPPVWVRVVRSESAPVMLPGGTSRLQHHLVAVSFVELSGRAKQAVAALCGQSFSKHEIDSTGCV